MKAAFIIPARNKEKWVSTAVDSALRQTLTPLEIVLSDQGSTDNTFSVMADMASKYDGPNKVSLMRCRDTEVKGMAGLNRHIHCIMQNVDADVYIFNSADDWSHAERSAKVLRAFEEFGPDYVGTAVQFCSSEKVAESVGRHRETDGFVTVKEIIEHKVGGSSSCAWSRGFYDRFGPIPGAVGPDTYLPPLAALGKGYYFLQELLHIYFRHKDPDNTGLGGIRDAMTDELQKIRVSELELWQIAAGLQAVMSKTKELKIEVDDESGRALMERFLLLVNNWCEYRHLIGLQGIPPMALPI